jgi:hypothetical protein
MLCDKNFPLVEVPLVKAVQIRQVNLEPSQTSLAKRLCFSKHEETATEIVAEVVQVWRYGVCTATEIKVVRQIQCITNELINPISRCSIYVTAELTARAISIL